MEIVLWTLILGLAYAALHYVGKILWQRKCLEDEVIEQYRMGRLKEGETDYEHVIGHLGICEKCQKRMGDF